MSPTSSMMGVGLLLFLCAALPARADFCEGCGGKVRDTAMGTCTSCGALKATSSGNRICPDCSKRLKECEACAALLDKDAADRIDGLIRQLGDEAAEKREEAQAALIAFGESAHTQLRKAAASAEDPEIRLRCGAVLRDFDVDRWGRFLFEALGSNEELRKDLAKRARHEGDVPALEPLRRPGACVMRETTRDAGILNGRVRFFTVPIGAWEIPDKPGHMRMTTPEPVFLIAITDTKQATVLSRGDLPALQKFLQPAADAPTALRIAILAARLVGFCSLCQKDTAVDAEKCSVKTLPDGGFEVTIPKEAVAPNKGEEGAVVTFTKEGQLQSVVRTGHTWGHR